MVFTWIFVLIHTWSVFTWIFFFFFFLWYNRRVHIWKFVLTYLNGVHIRFCSVLLGCSPVIFFWFTWKVSTWKFAWYTWRVFTWNFVLIYLEGYTSEIYTWRVFHLKFCSILAWFICRVHVLIYNVLEGCSLDILSWYTWMMFTLEKCWHDLREPWRVSNCNFNLIELEEFSLKMYPVLHITVATKEKVIKMEILKCMQNICTNATECFIRHISVNWLPF